jgi:lysophospholipase L1-like esterase
VIERARAIRRLFWRAFCVKNCRAFINLFPAFLAEKDVHKDWYDRLFIDGDVHFSAGGHSLMFRDLAKRLL